MFAPYVYCNSGFKHAYYFLPRFFRKGEVGNWKEFFEGDILKQWNAWIKENVKGTDINFKFE